MTSVLNEAYFTDEAAAFAALEGIKWPDGPVCPHCGGTDRIGKLEGVKDKRGQVRLGLHKCYDCRGQFTVRKGTVFEASHLKLHQWFQATYLLCSSKKGCSSNQIARTLGITVKSAWFATHRIREAMRSGDLAVPFGSGGGAVESDETYIGRPKGKPKRRAFHHKMKALTLIDRDTKQARSEVITDVKHSTLAPILRKNIAREARLMTDEAGGYIVADFAQHGVVRHGNDEYVHPDDATMHTNTAEGYFSVFKRGMKGIYQHFSERHSHRYVAEFDFRYNKRIALGVNDQVRTVNAFVGARGKRLNLPGLICMTDIPVSGRVLIWARDFRGLSPMEAAEKLGMTEAELADLEGEVKQPTLTQFEKIAATYRLPLATLFRRTPPPPPAELPDFRTFEGAPPRSSFEFSVALSNVRTLQHYLRKLRSDDENFHAAQLRQYDLTKDPFEQGEAERTKIGVTVRRQLDWAADDGFRHWRAVIEHLGISVYLQNFKENDCRGCALWEDGVTPAILINKTERSENGWVFTLIHEYAHLLVRRPGISDLNRRNPVEVFCNRFAAAFLMPIVALRRVLPYWPNEPIDWEPSLINEASRELKVSRQALAIRLEELGQAPEGFHRTFIAKVRKREMAKDGNYVNTRLSEIGGRFAASVMGALDRDVIDATHASEALGLSPPFLESARAYVERQRELASAE